MELLLLLFAADFFRTPKRLRQLDGTPEYWGDRDLAERLLYEHGMDYEFRADLNPQNVEVMAGTGQLENYRNGYCTICGAPPCDGCDQGLHS